MADAEGTERTETTPIEAATMPLEKEPIQAMDEEQSTAQVQDETPKSTENGHQTEEAAPEDESKEEPSKDDENAEQKDDSPEDVEAAQAEEITPQEENKMEEEAEEEEKVAMAEESENGDQGAEKKETPEDKPTENTEEKKEDEPEEAKESDKGLGVTVAKFYNEHKANTREERKTSPIFYLRNFNNWVKSVLINEFMEKYKRKTFRNLSVLDIGCGKGGDLLKWQKARISNLVCADIAEVSMKQCAQRYEELRYSRNHRRYNQSQKIYDAQFITADCTKELISEKFNNRNRDVEFDMTSCQFALHYAFESPEQAEKIMENACEKLKPGGYFIGTIPCANELLKRLRESETMSFENDCYKITFTEKENISLFGHKYDFHLEGVVDCPEFLVYFPLLEKMAAKFDLTLELAQGFHQFFEDHKDKDDYKFLLNRMNALETYPPRREGDKPMSDKEDAYAHAKEVLEGDQKDERKNVGTLRKDEWDAAGLYMVFAFKKAEESKPAPMEEDKTEVSEQHSVQNDGEKSSGEKMQEDKKVEEMETDTKLDEVGEQSEAGKIDNGDKKDEETDKMDEDAGKKDEGLDKKDEEGEKKGDDLCKDEDGGKIGEDSDKNDEEADKIDDESDKTCEVADKKDEEADKKDEDADKKDDAGDQAESEEKTSTEVGEQENTEAAKTPTPQRGRRKRSVGAAKDEASTPEEESSEATPKRGTRKRKSTGGTEEEPPEKKKA